jgi:hypothetical protein
MAKVKIIKNERDPPLFTGKLLIKFGRTLSFLVGTISNVLVMEIGWTDVGSGGYIILVLQCIFMYSTMVLKTLLYSLTFITF